MLKATKERNKTDRLHSVTPLICFWPRWNKPNPNFLVKINKRCFFNHFLASSFCTLCLERSFSTNCQVFPIWKFHSRSIFYRKRVSKYMCVNISNLKALHCVLFVMNHREVGNESWLAGRRNRNNNRPNERNEFINDFKLNGLW